MLFLTLAVLLINAGMAVWGFFNKLEKHWGLLTSFIGAIAVLFYSLAGIARTIKSVKNAFPNENFVWVNVWNLIIFSVLLLCDYSVALAVDLLTDENGALRDKKIEETFWRLVIVYATFNTA